MDELKVPSIQLKQDLRLNVLRYDTSLASKSKHQRTR